MVTARAFLVRGLLAGLIAGLAAFGVAYAAGEPAIEAAIALEGSAGDHAHPDAAAPNQPAADPDPVVPRSLQSTLGLLTATLLAGTALGGLVGVLTALALGRLGGLGARGTGLAVAGLGFVALVLVPFAVYPPNPPAVGSGDTIGVRSTLYVVLVAISVVAAVTAVLGGRRLAARWGAWPAGLAATTGYAAAIVVVALALPRFDEVPAGFPATVLYDFRMASLLTSFTLWAVLGVTLSELVHRRLQRVQRARRAPSVRASSPA